MTTASVFLVGTAVFVAGVLVLAAFSGRLRKDTRALIVRVAVGLFYPVVVLVLAQTVLLAMAGGDWPVAAGNGLLIVGVTVAGVHVWRNPTTRTAGLKEGR